MIYNMLNIIVNPSINLIRKGDYFHLSIEIFNDYNNCIVLKEIRVNTPAGFIPLGIDEEKPLISPSLSKAIFSYSKEAFISYFTFMPVPILAYLINYILRKRKKDSSENNKEELNDEELKEESKVSNKVCVDLPIQPKSKYTEEFRIKAGWGGGLRPRPESYNIYGKIKYQLGSKIYYQGFKVNVSIYASEGSMLSGTLVGSILGTFARGLSEQTNAMNIFQDIGKLAGTIFLNLIFAFVTGLILMRRKDVQPFLTIEDFWGGTLIGFLVGYFGIQFFLQIISSKGATIGNGTSNSTNSTGV
jgi:hypothetical protein